MFVIFCVLTLTFLFSTKPFLLVHTVPSEDEVFTMKLVNDKTIHFWISDRGNYLLSLSYKSKRGKIMNFDSSLYQYSNIVCYG